MMTIDVVNNQNEKVDSLELSDDLFGRSSEFVYKKRRIKAETAVKYLENQRDENLIWESVVHEEACRRRGTHSTKTRGRVSGTGKKPWRQKGTGRARVGEARNPLWRGGGVVFGPQPRDYSYRLPKKVVKSGLLASLRQKFLSGGVIVLDAFAIEPEGPQTRQAVELLDRLGVRRKAVLVDVRLDDRVERAVRNLPTVRFVRSNRLTARDVVHSGQVVLSRAAVEHLAQVLGK